MGIPQKQFHHSEDWIMVLHTNQGAKLPESLHGLFNDIKCTKSDHELYSTVLLEIVGRGIRVMLLLCSFNPAFKMSLKSLEKPLLFRPRHYMFNINLP